MPRHALGVLLCALMALFAVAAKVAPYYPQQQDAKMIASTKAFRPSDKTAPVKAQAVVRATALVLAAFLLVTLAFASVLPLPTIEAHFVLAHLLSPPLAIRPPPAR